MQPNRNAPTAALAQARRPDLLLPTSVLCPLLVRSSNDRRPGVAADHHARRASSNTPGEQRQLGDALQVARIKRRQAVLEGFAATGRAKPGFGWLLWRPVVRAPAGEALRHLRLRL